MKKVLSFFLALTLILTCSITAFAAVQVENEYISTSYDKQTVAPGETVNIVFTVLKDFTSNDDSMFDVMDDPNGMLEYICATSDTTLADDLDYSDGEFAAYIPSGSIVAGEKLIVSYKVSENAVIGTEISNVVYSGIDNLGIDDTQTISIVVSASSGGNTPSTDPEPTTGYTVTMGEDKSFVVGETVKVPVSITGDAYNAYDMSFTYDANVLELTMTDTNTEGYRVVPGDGTVRVQRYGEEVAGKALDLTFTAKTAGKANVVCTSAKVDKAANSIEFDAPDATFADDTTVVTVTGYTVTLGDDFTKGENEDDYIVENNGFFTIKPVDPNYDYTIKVTMNGKEETVTVKAGETYLLAGIQSNVVVETVSKTGKSLPVTNSSSSITGEKTATYGTDYIFTLTKEEGYSYNVGVSIGGSTYTGFKAKDNGDGTVTYTIPGADVTNYIEIKCDKTATVKHTVTFDGSGAGEGTGAAEVEDGKDYTFTINKAANYTYTVTAKMGENDAAVTEENGTYKIANVTGNLVITIDKVANIEVAVSEYVQMDAKTMFLITVTGTPDSGKVFAYGGNPMYKTTAYGENVYSYLVIVDKSAAAPTAETAGAMITQITAETVVLVQTYDVNASNKVDINDAQLVYDMYKGAYSDFTAVTVEKFLRADVNFDKTIDVLDATAIVNEIR